MKKKLLALVLVVVMAATAVVGGTMAYLTDEDSDVNVMTLGNVSIEQIEQEWKADESGLQEFTQAKPLYPYVGTLGWENKDYESGAYRRFTMNNVVDKYVSVKNTGKSNAYVRTVFAFEMGDYTKVTDFRNEVVGFSRNVLNGDEFNFPGAWVWGDPFVATINGENYMIWEAVHQDAVAPEATTIPSLLQVYMNKNADNKEVEAIDGNGNGTYDILVLSQAIQSEGWSAECDDVGNVTKTAAAVALDTGFGDVTADNVQKWFGSTSIPTTVSDADALAEALTAGKDIVLSGAVNAGEPTVLYESYYTDYYAYGTYGTDSISGGTLNLVNSAPRGLWIEDVASVSDMTINANNEIAALYVQAYTEATEISDMTVNSDKGVGIYAEYCVSGLTLNDCVVDQDDNGYTFETIYAFHNSALFAGEGSIITINGGSYTSADGWVIYTGGSAKSVITINSGDFRGGIVINGNDELIINGGTFTVNPSTINGVTVNGTVIENTDGTFTVQ